jgi:putative FmdB family regulatory protein
VPTYEYACESCGNRYEKREGFDAKPRQKCPACGKMAQRILSAPPIVFKGSGFYKTDSRAGDTSDSGGTSTATPAKADAAASHGHSHGPGGHTHGSTDTSSSAEATAAG